MINSTKISSQEIIEGLRNSNNRVVKYVYDLSYPLIVSLVNKNSLFNVDANEILHEGIVVLYENSCKKDFKLTCEVTTYLYSICRNIIYSRTKQQMKSVEITDVHEYTEVDMVAQKKMNEQELLILDLLETVGKSCKKILELYYFHKKKMDEIASEVGYTSSANAKNQKYKCLKKLKLIVRKEYTNA